MSKDDSTTPKQGEKSRWKVKLGIPPFVSVEYETEKFKGKLSCWRRWVLLRRLRHLREALEKNRADPYDRDVAILVDRLRQKRSDLLKPVGSDLGDVHRAVLFCIETLESENDFPKAMTIITERLRHPFSVHLKTDFVLGAGGGSATITLTKADRAKSRLGDWRRFGLTAWKRFQDWWARPPQRG